MSDTRFAVLSLPFTHEAMAKPRELIVDHNEGEIYVKSQDGSENIKVGTAKYGELRKTDQSGTFEEDTDTILITMPGYDPAQNSVLYVYIGGMFKTLNVEYTVDGYHIRKMDGVWKAGWDYNIILIRNVTTMFNEDFLDLSMLPHGSIRDTILSDDSDQIKSRFNTHANDSSIHFDPSNPTVIRSDAHNDTAEGRYSTSANVIEAGRGSGSVAMTTNDGYGNANIAFNHKSGTPDTDGNSARISVNVDSTSTPVMTFSLAEGVQEGQLAALDNILNITKQGVSVIGTNRQLINNSGPTYLKYLTATKQGGAEGGQIVFEKPTTSALQDDITLDVHDDKFRIFEQSSGKGVWIDFGELPENNHIKLWHQNNDGPSSGLNADMLDNYHVGNARHDSTSFIPTISSGGVLEVGRYVDFHHVMGNGTDYNVRLHTNGNTDGKLYINSDEIITNSSLNEALSGLGGSSYVHPPTHPASIITEDSNNRFVTDAQIISWNNKASTAVATTSAKGLMSNTDKSKLDGMNPRTTGSAAQLANTVVQRDANGNIEVNTTVNFTNDDAIVYDDSSNKFSVIIDGNSHTMWHSGNDGAGSGLDADTLQGIPVGDAPNATGPIIPYLHSGAGLMEVGRYIDFHHTLNNAADYNARLHTDGSTNGALFINSSRIVTENRLTGARIIEDTSHRLVTDSEKSTWNGKANASNGTVTVTTAGWTSSNSAIWEYYKEVSISGLAVGDILSVTPDNEKMNIVANAEVSTYVKVSAGKFTLWSMNIPTEDFDVEYSIIKP